MLWKSQVSFKNWSFLNWLRRDRSGWEWLNFLAGGKICRIQSSWVTSSNFLNTKKKKTIKEKEIVSHFYSWRVLCVLGEVSVVVPFQFSRCFCPFWVGILMAFRRHLSWSECRDFVLFLTSQTVIIRGIGSPLGQKHELTSLTACNCPPVHGEDPAQVSERKR